MSHRLPRVVLIGDSIRLGYESFVRAELTGEAFVWSPPENGQHTVNLLLNFSPWIHHQQPDVLQLNAGIWDTRKVARGDDVNVVPLASYRENVATLLTLAKRHTDARIIWATATPCDPAALDYTMKRWGTGGRDVTDISRYNAAAIEVATELGVTVNDLHGFVVDQGPAKLPQPDGVHFNEAGYKTIGQHVAGVIRTLLAA